MRLVHVLVLAPLCLTACFDKADDEDEEEDDSDTSTDDRTTADPGPDDSGWDTTWGAETGWSDDGWDTDEGTTTDTGATTVECIWDGTGFDFIIVRGDAAGYRLGFAEVTSDGWTGEDCYLGYTAGDGTTYSYCHPLSPSGGFLSTVDHLEDIVEGATTLHAGAVENTYFLEEVSTGLCWVWGEETRYYRDLGCSDISSALVCYGD